MCLLKYLIGKRTAAHTLKCIGSFSIAKTFYNLDNCLNINPQNALLSKMRVYKKLKGFSIAGRLPIQKCIFPENAIQIALLYSGFISIFCQAINIQKFSFIPFGCKKMRFCTIGHFCSPTINNGGPDKQPKHQAPTISSLDKSLSRNHHRV